MGKVLGDNVRGKAMTSAWSDWYHLWKLLDSRGPLRGIQNQEELVKAARDWGVKCRTLFYRVVSTELKYPERVQSSSSTNLSKTAYSQEWTPMPLFESSFITPYIHLMMEHAEDFIIKYSNLGFGSCQSLELMNNLH